MCHDINVDGSNPQPPSPTPTPNVESTLDVAL